MNGLHQNPSWPTFFFFFLLFSAKRSISPFQWILLFRSNLILAPGTLGEVWEPIGYLTKSLSTLSRVQPLLWRLKPWKKWTKNSTGGGKVKWFLAELRRGRCHFRFVSVPFPFVGVTVLTRFREKLFQLGLDAGFLLCRGSQGNCDFCRNGE